MTTSIFYLKFKENNENDMAAHGICFDFYYRPKPRQTGQKGCRAFVDTHLAGKHDHCCLLQNKNGTFCKRNIDKMTYFSKEVHRCISKEKVPISETMGDFRVQFFVQMRYEHKL